MLLSAAPNSSDYDFLPKICARLCDWRWSVTTPTSILYDWQPLNLLQLPDSIRTMLPGNYHCTWSALSPWFTFFSVHNICFKTIFPLVENFYSLLAQRNKADKTSCESLSVVSSKRNWRYRCRVKQRHYRIQYALHCVLGDRLILNLVWFCDS